MLKRLRMLSFSESIIFTVTFILIGVISLCPEPILLVCQNIIQTALFLFLVFLIYTERYRKKILLDKGDIFLWLFVVFVSINALYAGDTEACLRRYLLFIVPGLLLYFIGKVLALKGKAGYVLYSLGIFGGVVTLIGILEFLYGKNMIYQYFVFNPYYYRYISLSPCFMLRQTPRIMSTQLHPAVLGTYMIACIGSLAFCYLGTKKACARILSFAALASGLLVIIGTFSRSALIGLSGVLFVFLARKKISSRILTVFMFIALVVASFSLVQMNNGKIYRHSWKGLTGIDVWSNRVRYAKTASSMLSDHPLLGVGLDNYRSLFDEYNKETGEERPDEKKITDNFYLLLLAETGVLGFLSFVAFLFVRLKNGFRRIKLKKAPVSDIAIAAILTGLLINFNTYDALYWMSPLYLFWIFTGLISGQGNRLSS